jgi:hypothetical protein
MEQLIDNNIENKIEMDQTPHDPSAGNYILLFILSAVLNFIASLLKSWKDVHIPPFVIELFQIVAYCGTAGLFGIALYKLIKEKK